MCGACVSPGMRANPSTCRVLTSVGIKVVLDGGVPLAGPQEDLHGMSGYTPKGFTSKTR